MHVCMYTACLISGIATDYDDFAFFAAYSYSYVYIATLLVAIQESYCKSHGEDVITANNKPPSLIPAYAHTLLVYLRLDQYHINFILIFINIWFDFGKLISPTHKWNN